MDAISPYFKRSMIYRDRCSAKAEYRRSINAKSHTATTHISNDLHEQLLTKDCILLENLED